MMNGDIHEVLRIKLDGTVLRALSYASVHRHIKFAVETCGRKQC